MLKATWYKHQIKTIQDVHDLIKEFKKLKPDYGAFDTETNGLHIIRCTPFLLAFGFVNSETLEGHTYTLHFKNVVKKVVKTTMYTLKKLAGRVVKFGGHNVKFDLHMLANIGYPEFINENLFDTMIYIRLAHDAKSKSEGGVPDSLKDYARQYIDRDAKRDQKLVQAEITKKVKLRTKELKRRLEKIPLLDKYKITGRERSWTKAIIEELTKDKVVGIEGLDPKIRPIIEQWLNDTDDPDDYSKLPIEVIEPYAHMDIVYTLEILLQTRPVAISRGQEKTIELEENLIMPLYRMERVGFSMNTDYIKESKPKLRNYILQRRKDLEKLAGQPVSIGQHELIKTIFKTRFNLDVPSTGAKVLDQLNPDNPKAKEFVEVIQELRTLEKWYSTYLLRYLEDIPYGRIYTTIKQTGAASGRVSSGFQQFPKQAILDKDGNELFHPRKLVKPTGGKYNSMIFIDYSQVELRIQALYTLMIGHGDKNLCRAYMPYKCFRESDRVILFDHTKKEHRDTFNQYDWYFLEDPKTKWHPIDLHSLTTLTAFPELSKDDPDFKAKRGIGKGVNFACNYGAGAYRLHTDMHLPMEIAQKLFDAYTGNFPGVMEYRKMIGRLINRDGYTENIYGRKYYGISAHLAANYMVQGSAADFLKQKMIEVDEFLKDYKTRFQMNIHDEMSFEYHEDDPDDLPYKIQEIMENLPGTLVPIVADLEITKTTWAEKVDL